MAFKSVDRLTSFLAAMPERVSPDRTLYVLPPEEDDDLEVLDVDEDDDDAEPESFNDCPGYITEDIDKPLAFSNVDKLIPLRAAMADRVSPALTL